MRPSSALLPALLATVLSGWLDSRDAYELRRAELTDSDGDGFTPDDGDCNDADPAVHPGATETCKGIDDDCDDADETVNPDATEACNDGIDNDCAATATDPGIGASCHWASGLDLMDQMLITEDYQGDFLGRRIRRVGDLDDDGVQDVMIEANVWLDSYGGRGLLYLLSDAGTGSEDIDTVATAAFTPDQDEGIGTDFTGVDFNGDGMDDLLLGAYASNRGGDGQGGAYIFYGGAPSGDINIDDYDLFWYGESSGAQAGRSVDNIGDINGDCTDDIMLGESRHEDGAAFILWGGSSAVGGPLADADITFRGTAGATSTNVRYLGYMTRAIGDTNGDGQRDVLIGEDGDSPNDHYLFHGPFSTTGVLYDTDADVVLYGDDNDKDTSMALALGDLTGDGVRAIVLGIYTHIAGFDYWAGAVCIVPGPGL